VENRYNKEYEQYYIYALEQFLIKTYGFSEHDAKVKVMQDFDEVKEDFETKEIFTYSDYLVDAMTAHIDRERQKKAS